MYQLKCYLKIRWHIFLMQYFFSSLLFYSVSCGLSAAPAHTGTDRHRTCHKLLGPGPVKGWYVMVHIESLTVCAGRCRVKHRLRPLETRYKPLHTGFRLVLVQASLGRPLPVVPGVGRSMPVGPGAAERSQETMY